jgi:flagellar biosynthetic protein FliR
LFSAVSISVVLIPFLSADLPAPPDNFGMVLKICLFEITYGAFMGLIMQVFFSALNLAGNFAGQSIGFANAQIFDPNTQNQSMLIEVFLTIMALTLIFISDMHHLMLSGIIDSYKIFPVGGDLPTDDFAKFFAKTVNESFIMGFKVASPFIAFMIIFYTGMGLTSRLMPQLNIFFLSLPLQIYLGLGLLLITIPVMMFWFLRYFEEGVMQFIH